MNSPRALAALLGSVVVAALPTATSASIIWDWKADGTNHTGTFTTDGSDAAPLAAGSYTITDVTFLTSSFMPPGSYPFPIRSRGTTPPYTIEWDGTSVTGIDDAGMGSINGLVAGVDRDVIAIFGANGFGADGPGSYDFVIETPPMGQRGEDLMVMPRLATGGPGVIPEPTSLLVWGLLVAAAIAARSRRHYGA
jgi:hypothetical protein